MGKRRKGGNSKAKPKVKVVKQTTVKRKVPIPRERRQKTECELYDEFRNQDLQQLLWKYKNKCLREGDAADLHGYFLLSRIITKEKQAPKDFVAKEKLEEKEENSCGVVPVEDSDIIENDDSSKQIEDKTLVKEEQARRDFAAKEKLEEKEENSCGVVPVEDSDIIENDDSSKQIEDQMFEDDMVEINNNLAPVKLSEPPQCTSIDNELPKSDEVQVNIERYFLEPEVFDYTKTLPEDDEDCSCIDVEIEVEASTSSQFVEFDDGTLNVQEPDEDSKLVVSNSGIRETDEPNKLPKLVKSVAPNETNEPDENCELVVSDTANDTGEPENCELVVSVTANDTGEPENCELVVFDTANDAVEPENCELVVSDTANDTGEPENCDLVVSVRANDTGETENCDLVVFDTANDTGETENCDLVVFDTANDAVKPENCELVVSVTANDTGEPENCELVVSDTANDTGEPENPCIVYGICEDVQFVESVVAKESNEPDEFFWLMEPNTGNKIDKLNNYDQLVVSDAANQTENPDKCSYFVEPDAANQTGNSENLYTACEIYEDEEVSLSPIMFPEFLTEMDKSSLNLNQNVEDSIRIYCSYDDDIPCVSNEIEIFITDELPSVDEAIQEDNITAHHQTIETKENVQKNLGNFAEWASEKDSFTGFFYSDKLRSSGKIQSEITTMQVPHAGPSTNRRKEEEAKKDISGYTLRYSDLYQEVKMYGNLLLQVFRSQDIRATKAKEEANRVKEEAKEAEDEIRKKEKDNKPSLKRKVKTKATVDLIRSFTNQRPPLTPLNKEILSILKQLSSALETKKFKLASTDKLAFMKCLDLTSTAGEKVANPVPPCVSKLVRVNKNKKNSTASVSDELLKCLSLLPQTGNKKESCYSLHDEFEAYMSYLTDLIVEMKTKNVSRGKINLYNQKPCNRDRRAQLKLEESHEKKCRKRKAPLKFEESHEKKCRKDKAPLKLEESHEKKRRKRKGQVNLEESVTATATKVQKMDINNPIVVLRNNNFESKQKISAENKRIQISDTEVTKKPMPMLILPIAHEMMNSDWHHCHHHHHHCVYSYNNYCMDEKLFPKLMKNVLRISKSNPIIYQ